MKRDIEKDLIEIECAIKSQKEKDNIFTMSVLQRCYKLVSQLKEYKDLEEQNRLIKLPCAVGDTVYVLAECESIPAQLDGTLYGENGEPGTATGYYCPYENNCPFDDGDFEDCEKYKDKTAVFEDAVLFINCYESEMCVVTEKCAVHSTVGLHVFLTRQEAEAVLKELERGKGE